ncbi:Uncharacterized membrane protein YebE, DUF533 family [Palleronia marisminoris]|uniref:Inner membrane protein YebE n=1 Tax=Palleronia marisminoris TaxID=315423 RepID=A0A1Y5TDE8_9RHOB|nr:DUF533 domain-containing protein [Palleronia marisminoris]SFH32664.1 Uncharacterized membrane protein YebE, DUF533 family [Palleronia marisminoris]SLN61046.1 Inner membrane protein YebE [Palleronia marisminoris]
MKLKNVAMQMALAMAAAKGVQAFEKAGGIEGVRRKLSGSKGGTTRSGGFGGLLSQLGIADTGSGGRTDIAGLLNGLAGTASGASGAQKMRGLLDTTRETPEDTPEEEQVSGLMLRAMIQAARADGEIDAAERKSLMEVVGDADPEETAFIERQMAEPVDPEALARDTPEGHEIEVYTASVIAIQPDNRAEAEYLDRLARAMDLEQRVVNQIHEAQGKPPLYTL